MEKGFVHLQKEEFQREVKKMYDRLRDADSDERWKILPANRGMKEIEDDLFNFAVREIQRVAETAVESLWTEQ